MESGQTPPSVPLNRPASLFTTGFVLTTLAGVAMELFVTAYTTLNTDLGWMLDFGAQAVRLGHLPATNVRSFIEPDHAVVLHEWAACIGFYLVHARWGAAGLIALRMLIVAAALTVFSATLHRVTTSAAARLLTLMAAAEVLASGFQLLRPQLASVLLLAVVVHLALFGTRRSLWWSLPVFALWANLHGGWVAGAGALAAGCGARAVEQQLRWRPREVPTATLLAVPLLAGLCVLLNPYGAGLIFHTFHHVSDDVRLLNKEWIPLLQLEASFPNRTLTISWLVGSVILAALAVPPRRLALWTLLLLGVGAAFSANRNLRFAPLLIAPAVAFGLGRLLDRFGAPANRSIDRLVPIMAGGLVVAFAGPLVARQRALFQLSDAGPNPGSALWVMERNHLTGRLWNDFNWGGTILWAVPDTQVACDGRNVAAYSEATLRASMLFGDASDPVAVLSEHGADLVLVPASYPELQVVARSYPRVYCDEDACLLSRVPAHHAGGLILPRRPIPASAFFQEPTPESLFSGS